MKLSGALGYGTSSYDPGSDLETDCCPREQRKHANRTCRQA